MTEHEKEKIKDERRQRMADTIYRRMLAAGLDQERLSGVSSVELHSIERYLVADAMPGPDSLKKLARGLGCTVGEIIYEAEGVSQPVSTLFLSENEICRLTGRGRRNRQMQVLGAMGICYRQNGIGELVVSRLHVEQLLGGVMPDYLKNSSDLGMPNFAALGG